MCAWITLDKPNREHIFSHFLGYRKGISLAAREGFISSKKYRNDKNILMTHLFCSVSRSCLTLCNPMDCSTPGFHVHHLFPELAQTHVHWVGDANHFILCCPLLFLPSIFPSISVFSNESVLHIISSKYWSFSFCISPSNAYSGVICFRIDWLDLLAVQGTLTNLAQEEQDGKRSWWMWNTSLSRDTSGIHFQTQKCMQNTSWEWTGVHDQQKRMYRCTQNSRSSPEPLEWVHWLQDPRLPEN